MPKIKVTQKLKKASFTVSSPPKSLPNNLQSEPQTMEELLSRTGYKIRGLKKGEVVEGVVSAVAPKEILIDLGAKSEGVISERDLTQDKDYLANLKVGQKVKVYVFIPENDHGQPVLSLRKAGWDYKWEKLTLAKEKEETVEVRALEFNRGGLLVDWQGIRGFAPASQLDPSHLANTQDLVGKILKVKILEVDPKLNRLILSEKQTPKIDQEALRKIKKGEIYEGIVKGIAPFGIFVGLDHLEGLVHISEIAWERVDDLGLYFKVGEKIKVLVLGIDKTSGKLSLSVRQLLPDPWQKVVEKYPPGKSVQCRVTKLTDFGVFVRLEEGIDGLIHVSKIPPEKTFAPGEEVRCLIESVDHKKRRISLDLVLKEKPMGYK